MEVSDIHVGKSIQCSFSPQGVAPVPPLCFGFGPTAVPGTGFFNGAVLVGDSLNFPIPNIPNASLAVGRANAVLNPLAATAPTLFKVSNLASPVPPTPIDVMLGDPGKGMVGITVNSLMINIVNASAINIATPIINVTGLKNHAGVQVDAGAVVEAGAQAQAGAEARASAKVVMGPQIINGFVICDKSISAKAFFGNISACTGKKDFDIKHPTKEGHRLRYVSLEGPTADVYIRGKLEDQSVITLPDYWRGLVDPETITVNLTPFGCHQELFVESIQWGSRVIIKNNAGGPIKCHYTIYGERGDCEKNIAEYEGQTINDYPGDNSQYSHGQTIIMKEN
tara:strand:+ start:14884 stop:15897 length:1014 start_codon:yes stop_codon:yes gene_type:complete